MIGQPKCRQLLVMLYKVSRLKDTVHKNKGNVSRELTSSEKLNVK